MGNLCGSALTKEERDAIQNSSEINSRMRMDNQESTKVIKLLLLGTGQSGKSTIFKQMQILYEDGFRDFEKATFRHVIRRNVVEAMQTLIEGVTRFEIEYSTQESREAATFVLELDPLSADFWCDEIVGSIQQLWQEHAILATYDNRSKLQLLDSTQYLFENVPRIGTPDYSPTPDDILRARLRTSGIVEKMFKINGVEFKFLDVGGQRNERRKWIHCFEVVTAVIFVAAISEYDQTLYEDEKENRLMESIGVFGDICNNEYFSNTAMILFLNKMDLFQEKLQRVSIAVCFPDYQGNNSLEDAGRFVEEKFKAENTVDKMIFVHLTCATDTHNIQRVFDACKLTILRGNLDKLGLA